MKTTAIIAILEIAAAAAMSGCASLFGNIHSLDGARVWAEHKSRNLSQSSKTRTPIPPCNRSFLTGTWRTKTRNRSINSQAKGENWMEMDLTYRFSDDGTFVCDNVSSSKFGSYEHRGIRSSVTGTWSYENGKITMFSNIPRVGTTRERYNVIWYGKDEFELQVDATSIKDIRGMIGKAMQGLGWKQQSCEITCSDNGVSASWSEYANKTGDRRYYATVWTTSLMKRAAAEPCPTPSVRPADIPTAEPGNVEYSPSPKWRLVEKKDDMEHRARFTFELAEGVSVEEADRGIRPWVRNDRERAFRQANPDVDPGSVQVMADHETPNGRTLVYTASAFTTQPVLLGFEYNEATRHGFVSVRIHAHGDKEVAYDFAKRIIEKIVTNANVALEVGKEAPPGAKYRELDKGFQGNVFSVKFEAVE